MDYCNDPVDMEAHGHSDDQWNDDTDCFEIVTVCEIPILSWTHALFTQDIRTLHWKKIHLLFTPVMISVNSP